MALLKELDKGLTTANSWYGLLTTGREEQTVAPAAVQPSFPRDSDIVPPSKSQEIGMVDKYLGFVPKQYRTLAAIGGGLGLLYLGRKLIK